MKIVSLLALATVCAFTSCSTHTVANQRDLYSPLKTLPKTLKKSEGPTQKAAPQPLPADKPADAGRAS
jgi:hypothetical protein